MKLPFSFSLKFVFRLLLPGFILAVGFSPLLQTVLDRIGIPHWNTIAFILLTIFLGWIIVVMDMPIYMAFEGRRYWHASLRVFFTKREQNRLEHLRKNYERANNHGNKSEVLEISVELRKFPINEHGEFYAKYPTRLGNLIASYEEYSDRIYGMDSAFYWSRIWLTLGKNIQEDVDNQQGLTDSTIYTAFALYTCGFLSMIYTIFSILGLSWIDYLPKAITLVTIMTGCFIVAYFTYRVSLHLFAQFGETFKSLFDVYYENVQFQDVLKDIANLSGNPDLVEAPKKLKYKVIWRYLHNNRIKLHEGERSYLPEQLKKEIKKQEAPRDVIG